MRVGLVGLLAFSSLAPVLSATPEETTSAKTKIGVRIDCEQDFSLDKGDTQSCIRVSGLRWAYSQGLANRVQARLSLNPFAGVDSLSEHLPNTGSYPGVQDRALGVIEDYGIIWSPRTNFELALERYVDATDIPNLSQLSYGSVLSASGWEQTAVTMTYKLPAAERMLVKFVFGNGEGENGINRDPQQYFGFDLSTELVTGVEARSGFSIDGNSVGSAEYDWRMKEFAPCGLSLNEASAATGYSTKRIGLALMVNGNLPAARGLSASLGWQRIAKNDLSKSKPSEPSVAELAECPSLEPDRVFFEDPTGETVNAVIQTTFGLNSSYRILDTYFLGFDVERRKVDTGIVKFFEPCNDFVGESCEGRKTPQSELNQTSWALGVGVDIEPELRFSLEYNLRSYDHAYNKFRYRGRDGELSQSLELVNARLAYNWL